MRTTRLKRMWLAEQERLGRCHAWRLIEPGRFYCSICEAVRVVDDAGVLLSFTTKEGLE
jgi:hypothetical protein